jgi:hypothetical protein
MRSYLTIDVDFWAEYEGDAQFITDRMVSVLMWAVQQPNVLVARHHHMVTAHANKYPAHRLINIDTHSDVCTLVDEHPRRCTFDCGTWGAFVAWRGVSQFMWVNPRKDPDYGNCNLTRDRWNDALEWNSAIQLHLPATRLTPAWLKSHGPYTGISIALSPDWSDREHVEIAESLASGAGLQINERGYGFSSDGGGLQRSHPRLLAPNEVAL